MSYDIDNYAMLAISLPDFLDTLNKGTSVTFETSKDFILLNKKFNDLLKNLPDSIKESGYVNCSKIADDGFIDADGYSYRGPKGAVTAALLVAAGITNPIFLAPENELITYLSRNIQIFPRILIQHLRTDRELECESMVLLGNDRLNDALAMISICLSKLAKLNVIDGKVKDEDGNYKFTFTIPCIKSAIEDLYSLYKEEIKTNNTTYNKKLSALLFWLKELAILYVGSLGYEVDLEVVDTNWNNVHRHGGMEDNIPYVSFGGLYIIDEDGWNNPRDDDPEFQAQLENAIVRDSGKEFSVFTPQFGG
jgi:hypothetical protein